jgi:dihydropteroate synthase
MMHNTQVVKIDDLTRAKELFDQIGVAPAGIKIMAPKALYFGVKLSDVPIRAANILKQNMLVYGGDVALSKEAYYLNTEMTDIAILGTLKHFEQLCLSLNDQDFDLPCIADEIRETLVKYESYAQVLRVGDVSFDLSECAVIMGILNVTPDSFADGGKYKNVEAAIEHGIKMVEEGADLIDVGGESTRPGAEAVDPDEELRRVVPVIEGLVDRTDVPISIDTYKHEVAKKALDAGALMVNDISGLRADSKMARLVADLNVPVVVMHMQGTPRDMQKNPEYEDVVGEIIAFLREQTEFAIREGVLRERIIVDPGIGFGKNLKHNLEIMNRVSELRSLGFPILIGPSRKSFIGLTLDLPVEERLEGTAATVAYSIAQGANILRVHDVKEMTRVARMTDAIVRRNG